MTTGAEIIATAIADALTGGLRGIADAISGQDAARTDKTGPRAANSPGCDPESGSGADRPSDRRVITDVLYGHLLNECVGHPTECTCGWAASDVDLDDALTEWAGHVADQILDAQQEADRG